MKNKVTNALLEMGMPADLNGFQYIVDAVGLLVSDEGRNCKTTALYQKVAAMNNTTYTGTERAIRHAFGVVLTRGNLEVVDKYLTRLNNTNGNLLHVLYLRLTQEE